MPDRSIERIVRHGVDRHGDRRATADSRGGPAAAREIRALAEKNLLYRTVMETSGNKNMEPECKEIRRLWLQKRAEYRAFCEKNKIPRYDDRLKVIEGEDIYQRTVGKRDSRVKYEKISPQ
jgi:hypothetical protein